MEVVEGPESITGGVTPTDRKKRTSSSPQRDAEIVNSAKQTSLSPPGQPCSKADGNVDDDDAAKNSKRIRTSPNIADEAGSESPVIPEKLEVPSRELQCIQKQVLIEKLMATANTTDSPLTATEEPMDIQPVPTKTGPKKNRNRSKKQFRVPAPPSSNSQDFRKTFKLSRSSILDRVKSFLPEMKNANEELLRLPDPSKLSLESDSDEIDGAAVAGPSARLSNSSSKAPSEDLKNKTYVEMNLALVEQSDSDTDTSDDDGKGSNSILNGPLKGLPTLNKKEPISIAPESSPSVNNEDKADTSKEPADGKSALITELN